MNIKNLPLAAAAAITLLGAIVASASAGRLETSAQSYRATWTRITHSGGFGTVECEAVIVGTLHSRTSAKTVGALTGYITAANVNRCARGGASINRESLPWHLRFRSFIGTLPNITGISETITGGSWREREPVFGITCTSISNEAHPTTGTFGLSGGTVTEASISGEIPCGEFPATMSGTTTNVADGSGARLTIRLI